MITNISQFLAESKKKSKIELDVNKLNNDLTAYKLQSILLEYPECVEVIMKRCNQAIKSLSNEQRIEIVSEHNTLKEHILPNNIFKTFTADDWEYLYTWLPSVFMDKSKEGFKINFTVDNWKRLLQSKTNNKISKIISEETIEKMSDDDIFKLYHHVPSLINLYNSDKIINKLKKNKINLIGLSKTFKKYLS